MSIITECLNQVSVGEAITCRNLSLFPLMGAARQEPGYRLLDEAMAQGCARVTEVSDSGSVPELKFINSCDRPVLLLDGEEVLGAKQNRIVNLTVLAPAGKTIVIPVSCVEAGRWHGESREFSSAGRAHYAAGRARKAADVTESLNYSGTRRSDQSGLWADISAKAERMEAWSYTEAADAMYVKHRGSLDEYLAAFTVAEGQTGALFAINGEVVGLDLFDCTETLRGLLPKLVESYALDAIDEAGSANGVAEKEAAMSLIRSAAQASLQRFAALGEGEDLRLQGDGLAGGALAVDGRVVHLCVFRLRGQGGERPGHRGSGMIRASSRRRTRRYDA